MKLATVICLLLVSNLWSKDFPVDIDITDGCISSGILEGDELDIHLQSIVFAMSLFYLTHNQPARNIWSLRRFAASHNLNILDLANLENVRYSDGPLTYRAVYPEGSLWLTHSTNTFYWAPTSDFFTNTEQGAAANP